MAKKKQQKKKKKQKKQKKKKKKKAKKKASKKAVKAVAKKVVARKKAAKKAPAGHTSIAPGFTANDAAVTVKWYADVLGFDVIERWEKDGQFLGAQLGSGGVVLNIGQDDWKMGRDRVKGQGTRMYIQTTRNIDKYAADIKTRGGNLEQEPADGWGMRAFSIADPDGFKLTFMSPQK